MLESLASIFINANHLIDAQEDYNSLQIDFRELFSDFKIRYIYAADEAEVPEGQRFRGIYNKLTLPLKTSVYTQLIRLSKDFEELCLTVPANDTEARRLREQKNKKAVNNTSLIPKYSTSYTLKLFPTTTTPLVQGYFSSSFIQHNVQVKKEPSSYDKLSRPTRDLSSVRCYNCSQLGHLSLKCPELKKDI